MKRREILFILVSTLILVIAWIGFNVYHNTVTSTISDILNIRISPINPDFNIKDFEKLKERKKVLPIFEAQISTSASITTTPTPSITGSQQATSGGALTP